MERKNPFGILPINKPPYMTSRRVVDVVKKLVKPAKVGHAGTLDPLATGVIVVCVGAATRLISRVQNFRKTYRVRFVLGKTSDTDDVFGNVEVLDNVKFPTRDQVEQALLQFVGVIQQVPPQFSAVHVEGKRAYNLARQGVQFSIDAREVEIHRCELTDYVLPEIELEIECGSGTYVRSVGRDLGKFLGCGAVMSNLERTAIGPFDLNSCVNLDHVIADKLQTQLLPAAVAVFDLARQQCSPTELAEIWNGRNVLPASPDELADQEEVALLGEEDTLAAIAVFDREENSLCPKQVFLHQW